jgi:hypothetical protein
MAINERKRQKKLARKNAKRKKTILAYKEVMAKAPIIIETDLPEKMSEVLLEYAQPLLENAETQAEMDKALAFAVFAWNTSLIPPAEQKKSILALFEKLSINDPGEQADFMAMLAMMIIRKRQEFSDINRVIVNYRITDTGADFHVSVVSTLTD